MYYINIIIHTFYFVNIDIVFFEKILHYLINKPFIR